MGQLNVNNRKVVFWYIICIIVIASLIRIPFLFFVGNNPSTPFTSHDSYGYNFIANNIIHNQSFSIYLDNPQIKDPVRTPGYPLFLAAVYEIFPDNAIWVVVLQFLFGIGTAFLIFVLVKVIWCERIAFIAGLFYSINFHQVLFEMQILTEILFTTILILSILFFMVYLKKRDITSLFLSAFFLSLVITIRPIAILFPIIPFVSLIKKRISLRMITLFILIVILFPALWVVRNSIVFRRIFYTKIHSVNLVLYHAPSIISDLQGISRDEAKEEFFNTVQSKYSLTRYDIEHFDDDPDLCDVLAKEARKIVLSHPALFVKNQLLGVSRTVFPLNIGFTADVLVGKGAGGSGLKPIYREFIHTVYGGRLLKAFQLVLKERGKEISLGIRIFIIFLILYQLLLYVLTIIGVTKKEKRFEMLFFIFSVAYFTILPGGVGEARFRVPVEPFIVILASTAFLTKTQKENK